MIDRMIDWCSENHFLVSLGVVGLVLAGIWSLRRIPLDALPDISDVQVIIHTEWMGQPPNLIEDQVTYPIVTAMLAAPHVKAVRAQTMPNDSYVFVVFEDDEHVRVVGHRLRANSFHMRRSKHRSDDRVRHLILDEIGWLPHPFGVDDH